MSNNVANNQNLILVGGGGHCKSILDTLIRINLYDNICILDPEVHPGTKLLDYATVIGGDELLVSLYEEGERQAFIAVGSIKSSLVRSKLYDSIVDIGFSSPNIIDPSAVISSSASLGLEQDEEHKGAGIFVGKGVIVNADASIERCAIINTSAVIEHECQVGAFTHISVNVTLCGQVTVGDHSFIGAGSTVIQGIEIGSNVTIGAGSLILRDVKDGEKVTGIVKERRHSCAF
ncbi:acetyltransferase [Sporofaciens sp. JLR.KK001]|uniref:acetyltransferase n=1 Tax=Sporofaciens sp. JLR.KK001 TaxID=3112621 RepID=UPI002FEF6731